MARYGSLYLKLAKKSMEKGTDYANNEILRLDRMLEKVIDHFLMFDIINVLEINVINCIS